MTAYLVYGLNGGSGSDRQFQHHNTLFSIIAVTDETGAVLERYQYAPYREPHRYGHLMQCADRLSH